MSTDARHTFVADGLGVRLAHEAMPAYRPTEALLRVRYSLISPGTERHYIAQLAGGSGTLPLGYCAVGNVVACGDQIDHVAVGETAIAMGWTIATHSSHIVVPRRLICAIPHELRVEHALLATLGATAVHAADRARLVARDRVLVIGLGAVGMLMSMVAAERGCEVWGWDQAPAARRTAVFSRELDPTSVSMRGAITAVFLCVDGDLGALLESVLPLLDPHGNGTRRSRIVNVGRAAGHIALAPATGNIDLINASRCGAGYRDDAYHHGLHDVPVVDDEHTVDDNLRRCMAIIAAQTTTLDHLALHVHSPEQALEHYNSPAFFPPGLNLIDHGAT